MDQISAELQFGVQIIGQLSWVEPLCDIIHRFVDHAEVVPPLR